MGGRRFTVWVYEYHTTPPVTGNTISFSQRHHSILLHPLLADGGRAAGRSNLKVLYVLCLDRQVWSQPTNGQPTALSLVNEQNNLQIQSSILINTTHLSNPSNPLAKINGRERIDTDQTSILFRPEGSAKQVGPSDPTTPPPSHIPPAVAPFREH